MSEQKISFIAPDLLEFKNRVVCAFASGPQRSSKSQLALHGENGFGQFNQTLQLKIIYVPAEDVFWNATSHLFLSWDFVAIILAAVVIINQLLKKAAVKVASCKILLLWRKR